jgi:hypothetical protein
MNIFEFALTADELGSFDEDTKAHLLFDLYSAIGGVLEKYGMEA